MTKKEFLEKYPELEDDGNISNMKILLLENYLNSDHFKNDIKIKNLLSDYNSLKISEVRNKKINDIFINKNNF
jgi:hypothetical protein